MSGSAIQIGRGPVGLGSDRYCAAPTATVSNTSGTVAAIGGNRRPRRNQAPTATPSPAIAPHTMANGDGSGCQVLLTVTSTVVPSTTIGITASRI